MARHQEKTPSQEELDGNEPVAAPPEPWRARAWQMFRRFTSKPGPLTTEGVIFIVLAFLIGLAATNTGTNLLYLIFSLMIAFLLVSGYISKRALRKITAQRALPRHIIAGEPIDVRLTLANGKRLFGSYGLQATDRLRDMTVAGHGYFLHVPPGEKTSVTYPCVFHRRGVYPFHDLLISTTYPFGFVRRSIVVSAERTAIVYPQILPWDQIALEVPRDLGERESPRKGAGISLYGIREQHPSEGTRGIHWKKTAQTDRLMKREFEAEERRNVTLVLDNGLVDAKDANEREAFERAVVLAASVAHHLLEADQQVELVTRSGRVPPNGGPAQRYRILRALALVQPVPLTGRLPVWIGPRADTATIIFRCNGRPASESYPDGCHVYVVAPPEPATPGEEGRR
jgi:uncharacterized protein (DUF58 family)